MREFKQLLGQHITTHPNSGDMYKRTIDKLEDGKFVDLCCKVLKTSLEQVGHSCVFVALLDLCCSMVVAASDNQS